MNNIRRLVLIGSALTTMSACGPHAQEREVVPTPQEDYTALASGICFQFINYLKDEGNFSDPQLGRRAQKECTDRLAQTAAYHHGVLTGEVFDPGSGQTVDLERVYAISIAGNLIVPADAEDADYLAQLIERTK